MSPQPCAWRGGAACYPPLLSTSAWWDRSMTASKGLEVLLAVDKTVIVIDLTGVTDHKLAAGPVKVTCMLIGRPCSSPQRAGLAVATKASFSCRGLSWSCGGPCLSPGLLATAVVHG